VFIDMIMVSAVKMAVVQIIDVTFVFDGGMAASGTVGMNVLIVGFVTGHRFFVAHCGCPPSDYYLFGHEWGIPLDLPNFRSPSALKA